MKTTGIILAALLFAGEAEAHRHHHKLHKHRHGSSWEKTFLQIGLSTNSELFDTVNEKLAEVQQLVEVKKEDPACDDACKEKCDAEADEKIRELQNPVVNITWNCKNNYHVYTTDYDPDHSHFDRISKDVMDVQRVMNEISRLEKKINNSWNWTDDHNGAFAVANDKQVLRELKKEMGLPEDQPVGNLSGLNIREAIESAAAEHASRERSPGYIKAAGLDNE